MPSVKKNYFRLCFSVFFVALFFLGLAQAQPRPFSPTHYISQNSPSLMTSPQYSTVPHTSLGLESSKDADNRRHRLHLGLDMRFGYEDYFLNTLSFMYGWRKAYIEFGPNLRFLGGKYCKFQTAGAHLCEGLYNNDKRNLNMHKNGNKKDSSIEQTTIEHGLKGVDGGVWLDLFFQKNPIKFLGVMQRQSINLRLNYFYKKGSPWDTHYILLSPRLVFQLYPSKDMAQAIVLGFGFEAYTPLLELYKYVRYNGVIELAYSLYL